MRGHVSTHSTDLRTEMGNLGALMDEALDFMSESIPSNQGPLANTLSQPDIKAMLLNGFLSRVMPPSENGPLKEEWKIHEEHPQTTQD